MAPNDLRDRPLTEAAAIVACSGDGPIVGSIRKFIPRMFGDIAKTCRAAD